MNLLSPWSLLWLLPLAGGIVALWILKRRRQDVAVSSLFLWRAVLEETQANAPFQKLRRNILLFLQLLAVFLLIFALARPFVYGRGIMGQVFVVVLDTSASMNAADVAPSRLAAAKDEAKGFFDHNLHDGDVGMVIAAGETPTVRMGFTGDNARLAEAIDKTPGTDTPGGLAGAVSLAQSLVAGRNGARIEVFSDGVLGADDLHKLNGIEFGGTDVRQTVIGDKSPDNIAITAMDSRRDPISGRMEVFVHVQQFGSGRHPGASLTLLHDGKLIDARPLTLDGGAQSETFDNDLIQSGGIVTARLDDVQDDLSADNSASLVIAPPEKKTILLVTDGNLFLEQGLALDADVTLDECSLSQYDTLGRRGAGYDLVVFDGKLPPGSLPVGRYLIVGTANAQTPLALSPGNAALPHFIDENNSHPVMRFVDLTGLQVRTLPNFHVQPWAVTLADGSNGPWIAAGEQNGSRMVSIAFDLTESNWPLRVSFPIFLANAVDWLTEGSVPGAVAASVDAGTPAQIVVPAGPNSVSIARPDGETGAVAVPPAGGIVDYDRTDKVGVYHVRGAGNSDYPFAVNLNDAEESALSPRLLTVLQHNGARLPAVSTRSLPRVKNPLGFGIAAVALVLLLLEWIVYHRRG
jgi:Ca-activated chloride channel family protein